MPATIALYLPVFALFFVFLSLNVIRTRRREKIGLGAGGNRAVERAMRVHANFAEYVPLTLILLLVLELYGASGLLLNLLLLTLLVGRGVHAWGVSREPETFVFRVTGMVMTFSVIILASLALLFLRFA
jgi:uncharacterized membrane protein YecN with MAPEG domain